MLGRSSLVLLALLALTPVSARAAAPEVCPGDAIEPDLTMTGEFGRELMGGYVFVPFEVPAGTTAVRLKYCYDQPDSPTDSLLNHTLDLGLYEPRADESRVWGTEEFRGWGGSSHPDVTVSAEGFSSEAEYLERPKGHVPGKTTRGFRPGPIEPGRWAAELGVAAVVSQEQGDSDGKVAWRIEVELSEDPAFADEPYRPARYPRAAVKREPGWYAGDLHVHAEHSALGDATMTEVFDFAFGPRPDGAGLDFITLSDYVSGAAWGEIGRYQPRYPGKLIIRSAEVITYRGHLNSHANSQNMDYRTGPLYEWRPEGPVRELRPAQPPRDIFGRIHAAGGFTQINHPTIFPSSVPGLQNLCRGCSWDYSDDATAHERVDAWEVHTGPAGLNVLPGELGPNPFTLTAIARWDELRRQGHRITAVAVSDSHNAGRTNNPVTQSPIGQGTTMVYADELSEEAIERAVRLGRVFVKIWGSDGPDLRLDAVAPDGTSAMMGDPLAAAEAQFTARVMGGAGRQLQVLRDGSVIGVVQVGSDDFTHTFLAEEPGDYRLQLQRGTAIDALTNPITLGAGPLAIEVAKRRPRRPRAGKRRRFVFDVAYAVQDRVLPLEDATVRFAGRRDRTDARGRAFITKRIRKPGRYRVVAAKKGWQEGSTKVRVKRRKRR